MSQKCKFLYFGTPYVARDTLAMLIGAGYTPEAVVTSPDAPRGRGMTLTPSDTGEWATAQGMHVLKPEKLTSEAIEELLAVGADYAIVVAYGKILPQKLIDIFPKGVLNIHYSLLPKYRGASPVESALLNGETVTGVSIQQMVYQLDAGDVLASKEETILSNDTTKELRARLIPLGAQLLIDTLPAFEASTLTATPQNEGDATFSGKIDKKDGELTFPGNDQENWNKYRAYAESPGTYFFMERGGKRMRVKIISATLDNGTFTPVRVIPEGKKEMAYADFARA